MIPEALKWSFSHFYHMDYANASIHTAPVRFSPITFRLAQALESIQLFDSNIAEVLEHLGMYEEDKGR